MDECNSNCMYPNLNEILLSLNISNDQQFRLNKSDEIKDYFIAEIRERELMRKNISKYIASFDYLDKSLIVLSVATGSISISSFATAIGAPLDLWAQVVVLHFQLAQGL